MYCTSIIIPFYIVLFYTFQYYLYNCNIKFIHHALYTSPFIVINFCSTPLFKVFAHSSYLINLKIKCWNLRYCSCSSSVLDFFFYSFYHRWKTLKDVFSCSCRLNAITRLIIYRYNYIALWFQILKKLNAAFDRKYIHVCMHV